MCAALVAAALAGGIAVIGAAAWQDAPAYLDLFAPPARRGDYRAYVSTMPIESILRQIAADPATLHPPGSWQPRSTVPLDAFGQSGAYNRWALARLYGGRPALVARGPRRVEGRAIESWTLVSPYPDPQLRRLESGTLILVVRAEN